MIHASLDRSRSSYQTLLVAAGQNESAPKPGRCQTSTGQTSGSDLDCPRYRLLGGSETGLPIRQNYRPEQTEQVVQQQQQQQGQRLKDDGEEE